MHFPPLAGLRVAVCSLLLAVAGACAATTAPRPVTAPVAISSLSTVYGIQMQFDGSVTRRGGWLYVLAPEGSIRTYQGKAPAWDLTLRAGLTTCTPGRGWVVVSQSQAARLAPLVGFTRDSSLLDTTSRHFGDTLRLDLGVPPGTDLGHSRLTFELAWPIESSIASYSVDADTPLASPDSLGNPCQRAAGPGAATRMLAPRQGAR